MSDGVATLAELQARLEEIEDEREERLAERDQQEQEVRELAPTVAATAQKMRRRRITAIVLVTALALAGVGWLLIHRWMASQLEGTHRFEGEVVTAEGHSPVTRGERCSVDVAPNSVPNARLTVTCGDLRLYGFESFGQLECETLEGSPVSCADGESIASDGDPQLEFDRARESVILSDGPAWRVVIALDDHASTPG